MKSEDGGSFQPQENPKPITQILGLDLKLLFERERQAASAKDNESLVEHSSVRRFPFRISVSSTLTRMGRQTISTTF
jgi:hypothetical protein